MTAPGTDDGQASIRADAVVRWIILGIEYAIVTSLLVVAGVVLVRTVVSFLRYGHNFPNAVVAAIDGILVVIITLDIAHTVFGHLRSSVFPVRPFLIIGILAGVRDILSASAHLTLSGPLQQREFYNTLISLAVGVGVVIFLLLGLLILRFSGPLDVDDDGVQAHIPPRRT
jgi:Phosphate-starvation-inducible E family